MKNTETKETKETKEKCKHKFKFRESAWFDVVCMKCKQLIKNE